MVFEPFMQLLRGIQGRHSYGGISGIQNSQQIAYLRHLQKEINQEHDMSIPLKELNVVVFDIETTGFYPEKGDCILSIGATKMCGTTIFEDETFYSLIRCDKDIPARIVELTGITNEQISVAPELADVFIKFFQFAQDYTLVAHHANHEKNFMNYVSSKLLRTPFKRRIVDTSFLFRIVEPEINFVTLESLCEHNSIPVVDRHHALGDAKMTAKLWAYYLEGVQQMGCETLNDVYHMYAKL